MITRTCLFLRIPDGILTEPEREALCQSFQTVFSGFLDGLEEHDGFILFHLDALRERLDRINWKTDVTFEDDDLIFWTKLPIGHWYDFRHARGDSLPLVLLVSWWLETHVPEGEVYYGHDMPEGVGRPLTDPMKGALMYHYCRYGRAWYRYISNQRMASDKQSAGADTEREEMVDAYRADFGGLSFEDENVDPSWANFKWGGLAFRMVQGPDIERFQVEWDLHVPELRRDDLEPLLTSFYPMQRLRGVELACNLGGHPAGELEQVLEPLFRPERYQVLLSLLNDEDLFGSLPLETRQHVLARSLASEVPMIRRLALVVAESIGSAAPTR